jgi:hypothetical protein
MLDIIDLKILKEFSLLKIGEDSSTWKIMKKIFKDKGGNKENTLIKQKINKMSFFGLFKINGEKIRTYTMDSTKVFYKNFNFPSGNKKGISIFLEDKWRIYEL